MVDYPNNPPAGASQFTSATPYRGLTAARPTPTSSYLGMPSSSPAGGGYAEALRADAAMRTLPATTAAAAPARTLQTINAAAPALSVIGKPLPAEGVEGFIFHHTGGTGDMKSVVRTLQQRGLGVEYIMDRDGTIYRTPWGAGASQMRRGQGVGAGLSNRNTYGMEVIAKDDADVTPAQVAAAKLFTEQYYPGVPVFGHGEVNPHKQRTEGTTIANAIRGGPAVAYAPTDAEPATGAAGAAAGMAGRGVIPTPAGGPKTDFDTSRGMMDLGRLRTGGYAWNELPQDARDFVVQKYGPAGQAAYERWQSGLGGAGGPRTPPAATPLTPRPETPPTAAPGPVADVPTPRPRPATPPLPAAAAPPGPTPRENPTLQLGTGNDPATYTVMPGDTLFDIAVERYGDPNMARQLAGMNGIRNPRTLQPGQTLRLPPTAAEVPTPRARPDPNKIGPTYSEGGDATLSAGGRRLPYDTTGVPAVPRGTLPPTRTGGPDISFSPGGGFSAQPQGNRSMYVGDEGGAPGSRGATGTRDYAAELRRGLDTTGVAGEPAFSATSPSRLANTMLNRTPIMANDPNYPVSVDTGGFRSGSSAGRVDTSRAATPRAPMGAQTPYPNPFAVRSREDELRSMLAQRALDAAMQRRQLGGL